MAKITIESLILKERLRISSILESQAAEGRQALAAELALRTNLDSEAACAMLEKSPKATSTAADSFLRALSAEAIGLPVASGEPIVSDPRARRLAEIRANTARPKAPKGA